jgi:predicted nucleic acid-binding protein
LCSPPGPAPFDAFLADVAEGAIQVADPVAGDDARTRALITECRDFPLGFVDAAVVAVLERLREPKLATLDHRHFGAARPRHASALLLLPSDTG